MTRKYKRGAELYVLFSSIVTVEVYRESGDTLTFVYWMGIMRIYITFSYRKYRLIKLIIGEYFYLPSFIYAESDF